MKWRVIKHNLSGPATEIEKTVGPFYTQHISDGQKMSIIVNQEEDTQEQCCEAILTSALVLEQQISRLPFSEETTIMIGLIHQIRDWAKRKRWPKEVTK